MIWDELCKLALIGTDRLAPSEGLLAGLRKIGVNEEAPDAQKVLEGAAVYYNLQRAGFSLAKLPPEGSEKVSFKSALSAPTADAARFLQLLLSGRYAKALPECLDSFRRSKMSLPAEQLPLLFELGLTRPALWKKVQALMEEKERWLLRQNPEWQALAEEPDTGKWGDSGLEVRAAILRHLRRTRPESAADLMREDWASFAYTDKKALLQELWHKLDQYDEVFLKRCLEDSRKEVRMEAAKLLAHIKDSDLQQQLQQRAIQVLSRDTKGQLKVSLITKLDEELKKLGIDHKKSKYRGDKAAVTTYELLGRIPPSFWETHFRRPILDLLRMAGRNTNKRMVLQAFGRAALSFGDARWVDAILRYWWRQQAEEQWSSTLGKQLMAALPDAAFNEMIVQHFKQEAGYLQEDAFITTLILLGKHEWEDRCSLLVIRGFQQWIASAQSYYWNLWHYKRILKVAAYRANPSILDKLSQGWDARSPVWPSWEAEVERMLKTLAFRKDMRKAFINKSK